MAALSAIAVVLAAASLAPAGSAHLAAPAAGSSMQPAATTVEGARRRPCRRKCGKIQRRLKKCGGLKITLYGSDHDDAWIATPGDDVIATGRGNDTIDGGGGNDVICGGGNRDVVHGGL